MNRYPYELFVMFLVGFFALLAILGADAKHTDDLESEISELKAEIAFIKAYKTCNYISTESPFTHDFDYSERYDQLKTEWLLDNCMRNDKP